MLTFVDNLNRKLNLYFLKHKNEAFVYFKQFKPSIKNETGKKIKRFRTDNEPEFCSNELCKENRIDSHCIVPKTP